MIAFGWRQFRVQFLSMAALLVALTAVLVPTGVHAINLYDENVLHCTSGLLCAQAQNRFGHRYVFLQDTLSLLTQLIPGAIGVFWGAPLVARELESGTYRLAWTQGVSRSRWLLAKLGMAGLGAAAVGGLSSWVISWWYSPFDRFGMDRFDAGNFGERGIVAIGYALFAVTLGVALGVVVRRVLPAMALTLVGFIGVRIVVTLWVRRYFLPPAHEQLPLRQAGGIGVDITPAGPQLVPGGADIRNGWVYSGHIEHLDGSPLTPHQVAAACPSLLNPPPVGMHGHVARALGDPMGQCIRSLGSSVVERVTFQPANRYWTFQWMELGLFVLLAAALSGFALWWVRRRLV